METIDQQQIDAWKQQYGRVYKITVAEKTAWFRPANTRLFEQALKLPRHNPIELNQRLLQLLYIGGDKQLSQDANYSIGASTQLKKMLNLPPVELQVV